MRSVFGNGLNVVVRSEHRVVFALLILNFWVVASLLYVPNNQPMIMGLPMAKVGTSSHHPLSTTRDTVMESVNCYSKMTKQLLMPTQTREEENLQKIH